MSAGLIAAFLAVMGIACVHIPSFTSSVLKLRSGISPSLKSDDPTLFASLRKAPDYTASIFGTCFWGCLFTAGLIFIVVTSVVFLLLYSVCNMFILMLPSATARFFFRLMQPQFLVLHRGPGPTSELPLPLSWAWL